MSEGKHPHQVILPHVEWSTQTSQTIEVILALWLKSAMLGVAENYHLLKLCQFITLALGLS